MVLLSVTMAVTILWFSYVAVEEIEANTSRFVSVTVDVE